MTREEAIEAIKFGHCDDIYYRKVYEEALDMAIKALEQEPCEDCISRKAALEAFGLSEKSRKYGGDHSGYDILMKYEIQDILEALPPVTPQPKIGHNCNEDYADCDQFICSECGIELQGWDKIVRDDEYDDISYQEYAFSFCPSCGCEIKEVEQ